MSKVENLIEENKPARYEGIVNTLKKPLKMRLIPVKKLSEEANHNWEDLRITNTAFYYDWVQLTIANIHSGEEVYVDITVPEFEDKGDDLLPKMDLVENTGYTYARAYAKSVHKLKLLERIKDGLLWLVHPLYEDTVIWEEQLSECQLINA